MIVMIQGKTREDRLDATSATAQAVGDAGGCVLDFKQFSNLAICFSIELPPVGFARLRRELAELNVDLDGPTDEEIASSEGPADADVPCSLRIAFIHGEPDLRIEIPSVPG